MDALNLVPGNRVFHLGCGLGYYTAIMAEVVGSNGRVTAIEIEAGLAARARGNLVDYPQVTVCEGDGALFDPGECDAIFINAGVTHPNRRWLRELAEGGRMVLPLTTEMAETSGRGVMVRIARELGGFSAQIVSYVLIYSCASMRDPLLEEPLAKALRTKSLLKLRSVRLEKHEETDTCLLHANEICLSSAEAWD
jgi:protein-L-isoaspartate(D-aspartate) O-methyltransferase